VDKDEVLEAKLKKIQDWKNYSAQDMRERAANHLINHYYEALEFLGVFQNEKQLQNYIQKKNNLGQVQKK
jgi:hypothetical protein